MFKATIVSLNRSGMPKFNVLHTETWPTRSIGRLAPKELDTVCGTNVRFLKPWLHAIRATRVHLELRL